MDCLPGLLTVILANIVYLSCKHLYSPGTIMITRHTSNWWNMQLYSIIKQVWENHLYHLQFLLDFLKCIQQVLTKIYTFYLQQPHTHTCCFVLWMYLLEYLVTCLITEYRSLLLRISVCCRAVITVHGTEIHCLYCLQAE